jgi:hypothetical protein
LSSKPHGSKFNPAAAQIITKCFAHPCGKKPMKMERGKMRNFGQSRKIKWLIKVRIDMGKHAMHSAVVFRATVLGSHKPAS